MPVSARRLPSTTVYGCMIDIASNSVTRCDGVGRVDLVPAAPVPGLPFCPNEAWTARISTRWGEYQTRQLRATGRLDADTGTRIARRHRSITVAAFGGILNT